MGSEDAAAGAGSQCDLVDLCDVDLMSLSKIDLGGSVLEHSIRRILDDAGRQQDAVAGWNSAL
jgi:FXSXX-COOH protein